MNWLFWPLLLAGMALLIWPFFMTFSIGTAIFLWILGALSVIAAFFILPAWWTKQPATAGTDLNEIQFPDSP